MAADRALVIGGTGPTGPFVVEGLVARGFDVTILHAGHHEVEFAVGDVRHIHADPHFPDSLAGGIGRERFDLVIAQYGRLAVVADTLAGRTDRLIALGGAAGFNAGGHDERWGPLGRPELFLESTPLLAHDEGPDRASKLRFRMAQALTTLFDHHDRGAYAATYLGLALVYGPRNPGPFDWAIIRRALDRRRHFVIADGGLKLESRIYSENAAHAILLAVDQPEIASGRRYNVTEGSLYSLRQRIEFVAHYLGHDFELVDLPFDLAWPCHPLWRHTRAHHVSSGDAIRHELGYVDVVDPAEGYARTIEWLRAHPPAADSETARQVGDPFDYAREDELITWWERLSATLSPPIRALEAPGHQYRHPTAPGEAWRPAGGRDTPRG